MVASASATPYAPYHLPPHAPAWGVTQSFDPVADARKYAPPKQRPPPHPLLPAPPLTPARETFLSSLSAAERARLVHVEVCVTHALFPMDIFTKIGSADTHMGGGTFAVVEVGGKANRDRPVPLSLVPHHDEVATNVKDLHGETREHALSYLDSIFKVDSLPDDMSHSHLGFATSVLNDEVFETEAAQDVREKLRARPDDPHAIRRYRTRVAQRAHFTVTERGDTTVWSNTVHKRDDAAKNFRKATFEERFLFDDVFSSSEEVRLCFYEQYGLSTATYPKFLGSCAVTVPDFPKSSGNVKPTARTAPLKLALPIIAGDQATGKPVGEVQIELVLTPEPEYGAASYQQQQQQRAKLAAPVPASRTQQQTGSTVARTANAPAPAPVTSTAPAPAQQYVEPRFSIKRGGGSTYSEAYNTSMYRAPLHKDKDANHARASVVKEAMTRLEDAQIRRREADAHARACAAAAPLAAAAPAATRYAARLRAEELVAQKALHEIHAQVARGEPIHTVSVGQDRRVGADHLAQYSEASRSVPAGTVANQGVPHGVAAYGEVHGVSEPRLTEPRVARAPVQDKAAVLPGTSGAHGAIPNAQGASATASIPHSKGRQTGNVPHPNYRAAPAPSHGPHSHSQLSEQRAVHQAAHTTAPAGPGPAGAQGRAMMMPPPHGEQPPQGLSYGAVHAAQQAAHAANRSASSLPDRGVQAGVHLSTGAARVAAPGDQRYVYAPAPASAKSTMMASRRK